MTENLTILKPTLKDIEEIQSIVLEAVKRGIILSRTDDEVATNIRSYIIAKINKKIVGVAALHIHTKKLGEIRSLVVKKEFRKKGIGKKIVKSAIEEAKELQLEEILVLTYVKEFFEKFGFQEIEKLKIPEHKIWTDCIKCIHFPVCNEVSLVYKIGESNA